MWPLLLLVVVAAAFLGVAVAGKRGCLLLFRAYGLAF
jgi:hypothetical protein